MKQPLAFLSCSPISYGRKSRRSEGQRVGSGNTNYDSCAVAWKGRNTQHNFQEETKTTTLHAGTKDSDLREATTVCQDLEATSAEGSGRDPAGRVSAPLYDGEWRRGVRAECSGGGARK